MSRRSASAARRQSHARPRTGRASRGHVPGLTPDVGGSDPSNRRLKTRPPRQGAAGRYRRPELGACLAGGATRAASGRRVTLVGDPTQATRDRYGRLLAYVWLPSGRDLAYQLLERGLVPVYVHERPFARLAPYRRAEAVGRRRSPSIWRSCGTDAARGSRCDLSHRGVCVPSPPPDLDCADVTHTNFRVVAPDPHRFDGDGDGYGCEG